MIQFAKLQILTTLVLLAFAGMLAAETPSAREAVSAAARPATRLGFVDVEIVMDNSRAIRAVLDELDTQMSDKAREIDLREREFRRKRFDLDRQERVLSAQERERRREELLELEDEITQLRFSLERDFQSAERAIEPVLERVFHAVADVAEREGIDMVVRGEVVIYGSQRVDLTTKVIEELDRHEESIRRAFLPERAARDESPPTATEEPPDEDESDTAYPEMDPEHEAPPVRDGIPPAPRRSLPEGFEEIDD